MGNTCFMNAVEQVILHAVPFQQLLGAKLLSPPMLLENELLEELRDSNKSVIEPNAHYAQLLQWAWSVHLLVMHCLLHHIWILSQQQANVSSVCNYEKGNQQDCAEFYEWTMGRQADPPNIAPLPFQGHWRSDVSYGRLLKHFVPDMLTSYLLSVSCCAGILPEML